MKKIPFVITLFVFCIGLVCIGNKTPDNDVWARLIAGNYIIEHLAVLKNDFLSYTQTHAWYDHEWGASAVFSLVLKYFGGAGLILLKGIIAALTVFFCYKTADIRKSEGADIYNILYFAFMFWCVSGSLGGVVRCLIFTCLFFAIFVYILEMYRKKGGKCLIWLPFLMIIWSNMHGGCISGLALLGIYVIGEFLNKKPVKPYIYTILGCCAALFINPYGFEYVKFLFFAAAMDRSNITEWLSPFIKSNAHLYLRYKLYLAFIFAVQIIYLIKYRQDVQKLDKTKLLSVLAMAYLSVTKLRHITFFIFTAGALMYNEFYVLANDFINKIKPKDENAVRNFVLLKNICIYMLLLVISLPAVLGEKKVIITESAYPRFAVEFIKINNIKGNLLLSFDWGSYAAYKLYPNNLISMDGRYEEVYDPKLLESIKNFYTAKRDWYKIVRDYKTDVMILEKRYPVYNRILEHPDWTLVFDNNLSGVFVPSNSVKEKYLYPIPDDKYYNDNVFETNVFKI